MDQLHEFCARMLGDRDVAQSAAQAAREAGGTDRVAQLSHAVRDCRARLSDGTAARPAVPDVPRDLAEAVAAELAAATACLPQRQREALALRELVGLTHQEIGAVIGIEPTAVAALLARSRLGLRAELRGAALATGDCPERERTLRTATLRHDSEPVPAADDDWLIDHLGHCAGCARLHSAMLEASVCYRGWRPPAPAGA